MTEEMCFIGRAPCCGNIVACVMDGPERSKRSRTAMLGRWVADGLVVSREPVSVAQQGKWRCECGKEKKA